jgi:hypothetical protein
MGLGSRLWKNEKFSDCTLVLKTLEPIVNVVQTGRERKDAPNVENAGVPGFAEVLYCQGKPLKN